VRGDISRRELATRVGGTGEQIDQLIAHVDQTDRIHPRAAERDVLDFGAQDREGSDPSDVAADRHGGELRQHLLERADQGLGGGLRHSRRPVHTLARPLTDDDGVHEHVDAPPLDTGSQRRASEARLTRI
jgi:hypothetical protein